jgi:NTP pyrophosphatase (non-canonical NTP hydrolase)
MKISDFQNLMRETYGENDDARGIPSTIAWITEEVGEMAQAVRKGTREQQVHEIGDVIAWVVSLANQLDIEVEDAVARFVSGCPKCNQLPCTC